MTEVNSVPSTAESWELRELGLDDDHVQVDNDDVKEIDDAAGLQMISIRLQKSLIDELKIIAGYEGVGYQPLIRESLTKFAEGELKRIAKEYIAREKENENEMEPVESDSDGLPTKVA